MINMINMNSIFNINIIDNGNKDLHFFVGLISNQNNIEIGTNKEIKVIL